MNQLKKLNAMHKLTMLTIQGAVVLKEGCKIYEGWKKGDHIQHTSDSLLGQIKIFERQTLKVYESLEKEDRDFIKTSLDMYEKDKEKLKFNIKNDKIDKHLFKPLKDYIDLLKEVIEMLKIALT